MNNPSEYEYLGSRGHQPLTGRASSSPREQSAGHRATIMQMLRAEPVGQRKGIIGVMGAGECHDLDLPVLLDRYHEIHLFDLDTAALDRAVESQGVPAHPRIRRYGGTDVSGIHDLLGELTTSADDPTVGSLVEAARQYRLASHERFDVVVSANLLPELVARSIQCLGSEHPGLAELAQCVVQSHIEMLLDRTVEGGQALLVTELANSRSVPELLAAPADLGPLVRLARDRGGLHPGCNPAGIEQLMRHRSALGEEIRQVDVSPLWIRHSGDQRGLYLAWRMIRKTAG